MRHKLKLLFTSAIIITIFYPGNAYDYYPLKTGNNWFYKCDVGYEKEKNTFLLDTINRKSKVYHVAQFFERNIGNITFPDTIRSDEQGNIWRYGTLNDTLWFELSEDTSKVYNYGIFRVTKKIIDAIITPFEVFRNCLCLTFTDSSGDGYHYVFVDSIGMIDHSLFYANSTNPYNVFRLKSAFVNGKTYGLPTEKYDYFPLKSGNKWVYYFFMYGNEDTIVDTISDIVNIDNKKYFKLTRKYLQSNSTSEHLLIKDTITGNVYELIDQEEKLFNKIDFSVIEGKPYLFKKGNDSLTDTSIASWFGCKAETPAGVINHCRYYKKDIVPLAFDDEFYFIYAPGIGNIKYHYAHALDHYYELIYAIIDGEYIGSQVNIKSAKFSQLQVKKKIQEFVLIKGFNQNHSLNKNMQVFSLNGRCMGFVNRFPGKNFAQRIFILKQKEQ